jgi:biphenyl-2,3-diol 1,2-dioxygenase
VTRAARLQNDALYSAVDSSNIPQGQLGDGVMLTGCKLGYLAMQTRHRDRWLKFNDDVLGLPQVDNADGSIGLQLDGARQRLMLAPGAKDDVLAVGLEFADDTALEMLQRKLAAAGVMVEAGTAELAAARGVRRLLCFADPVGTHLVAFADPAPAERAFASGFFPHGFETGDTGFGHVVLAVKDIEAAERFYCGLLGFAVTERLKTKLGPVEVRGIFLHCNRRHHSLALFAIPASRRLHHFMLQAHDITDVGRALERFEQHRVPFSLGLGQHPAPDSTVSFYAATPSGFDIEIGAAGHEIEPVGWQERQLLQVSSWGHKPSLRLRLGMMKNVLAQRIGLH